MITSFSRFSNNWTCSWAVNYNHPYQKDNPGPDKEANWLPAGDGPFYLIVRSYAPAQQAMDILTNVKAWPVPAVVPVN